MQGKVFTFLMGLISTVPLTGMPIISDSYEEQSLQQYLPSSHNMWKHCRGHTSKWVDSLPYRAFPMT